MAALSPASKAAIARLRSFVPPPTQYQKLPLTRRAAVLILLFADRRGDLRVVLTIRSAKLKNYAGQAALPGGKADSETETPWTTALREAHEEIGLPYTPQLPASYTLTPLTQLPCNLAMTELSVRPCIAFLSSTSPTADPAKDLLPTLDAREVAAVFTAPFEGFLKKEDADPAEGEWYKGAWHAWHAERWRMHMFHVPVRPRTVFRSWDEGNVGLDAGTAPCSAVSGTPVLLADQAGGGKEGKGGKFGEGKEVKEDKDGKVEGKEQDALDQPRYRVFGMTARILVDAARVAYGRDPEFMHNSHFGDEEMIGKLMRMGSLGPVKRSGEVLTRDVMVAASKLS